MHTYARTRVASFFLVGAMVAVMGCKGSVPKEHTSLSIPPGQDPGKPAKTLTMNWMHHSTGKNLLEGGLLAALQANNIKFHDMYYEEGKADDGYVIGDHTNPEHFPKAFNTPKYFDVIRKWELEGGKQHDIVMFKSCFPASDIKDEATYKKYQDYYKAMLPTFEKHKDILFIGMSTPPLMKGKTTPDNAKRARKWARWVTTEYSNLPNVKIFDLFAAMAIIENKPDQNTLAPQFGAAKYDSHPTKEAAQAVTRLFIPWLNRVLRDSGKVKD